MRSKIIISLIKSYLATLVSSTVTLLLLFLLFNDIITKDEEGPIVYFIMGTVLTFFIPIAVMIFFLLPISLIEEKRIIETSAQELIKRYLPFPVLIFSAFYCFIISVANEDYGFIYFFTAMALQVYSIVVTLLCTYIHQLKS